MRELWGWSVYGWLALPTVMYGGYALLGLLTKGTEPTAFQRTWFRAGHAHAGVLMITFLVFVEYLERTGLALPVKHAACATFVVGALAQSGGFFLHLAKGREGAASVGTTVTAIGAVVLAVAIATLVYGIVKSR
jgi:heme/copper-type cytochrome/quinol oxidase subunit 4